MVATGLSLVISLLPLGRAAAQEATMREVFKTMPDSLTPYLSQNNRLDFIDFKDSDMEAKVTNALNGTSTMDVLTDRFLQLTLSESCTLQLRLLPVSEPVDSMRQVVCMVRTVGVGCPQSRVSFYTCSWQPLDWTVDDCFGMADLLVRPQDMREERFRELKSMVSSRLYQAQLSADSDEISIRLSAFDASADDLVDLERIRVLTKLKWNGRKFNKY